MAYPNNLSRTKNWGTEVLTDTDLEGQFDLIINYIMDALNNTAGHTHDGTANEGGRISPSNLLISGQSTGDLLYASSASAWSSLDIGNTGDVIKVTGGVPAWTANTTNVSVMFYIDGTLSTGDSQSAKIRIPFAGTITRADAYIDTAPTDASILIQAQINDADIWTDGQRLTIEASATSGTTSTFTTSTVSDGDYITLDIDQVGSTVAGSDLTVSLTILKTI